METFSIIMSVEEMCAMCGINNEDFFDSLDTGDMWEMYTPTEREADDLYRMDDEIDKNMNGYGCLLRRSNTKTGKHFILLITNMNDYYKFRGA